MVLDSIGLMQPIKIPVDISRGLVSIPMRTQLMKGDKSANRVMVEISNGSEKPDLTGVVVTGSFIRPPDAAEVPLEGEAEENVASVILSDACYAQEGYCEIYVKLTIGGTARTILALTGNVRGKGSGAYVDIDGVIPSIDDIIAQYAEMKQVTQRTIEAAERAEKLAIDANGYAANAGMLGGKLPSEYLGADETAVDSNKLGGRDADEYLLKTELPETEEAVGGAFVTPQMFVTLEDPYDADGVFVDKDAIQAAFNESSFVAFPEGRYRFSGVTCEHDVHVIFAGAELVPVHPTYDASASGGKTNQHHEYGVFENFFSFGGCSVVMEGLRLLRSETSNDGVNDEDNPLRREEIYLKDANNGYILEENEKGEMVKVVNPNIPQTRSIAEFEACPSVILRNWHVGGLALFNRGKTPSAFADRKGIVFSAIDTDILVQDCTFENLYGDEWTWCTRRNDIYATKCTFDHCIFRAPDMLKYGKVEDGNTVNSIKPGLSCVGIFLTSEATVENCIFENIVYYGSLINVAGLRGVVRNNIITNCDLGGVFDFLEGSIGYIFADDIIVENNTMGNSTCGNFAKMAARRMVIRGNSGIVANQFVFSTFPHKTHVFSTEGPVKNIRIVVEGNDAFCANETAVAADKAFVRFKYTEYEEVWVNGSSEAVVRGNRFLRQGNLRNNPCIVAANVNRLDVIGNNLFFGAATGGTTNVGAYAIQAASSNINAQRIDVMDNIFSSELPTGTTAETRFGLRVTGAANSGTNYNGVTAFNKLMMNNVLFPSGNIKIEDVAIASNATIKEVTSGNAGFAS